MDLKLIKNSECIDKEKVTLLCLPFAGGGASVYNQWVIKMKNAVTVCPIQLPGREERITETPYIDMTVLLDDLEDAFKNTVKGPYTLWGHSMGGKIAYELEKRLEENGYTALHDCFGDKFLYKKSIDAEHDEIEVVCSEHAMIDWAMQFCDRVEVIRPQSIRKKIKEKAEVLYRKYS